MRSGELRDRLLLLASIACVWGAEGCCARNAARRRPIDSIERYVIVGLGAAPECPLPRRFSDPVPALGLETSASVWLRSVAATDVRAPVVGDSIELVAVDSFGSPSNEITILPTRVGVGRDGFATSEIVLRTSRAKGHYRVRAQYMDKSASAYSYSSVIIVGS